MAELGENQPGHLSLNLAFQAQKWSSARGFVHAADKKGVGYVNMCIIFF